MELSSVKKTFLSPVGEICTIYLVSIAYFFWFFFCQPEKAGVSCFFNECVLVIGYDLLIWSIISFAVDDDTFRSLFILFTWTWSNNLAHPGWPFVMVFWIICLPHRCLENYSANKLSFTSLGVGMGVPLLFTCFDLYIVLYRGRLLSLQPLVRVGAVL